ncbi:ABC transporter substrate-binding protein [Rhodococcus chondri]|uniref:Extracellular solute-binding protein n=1 Tax=Rhodococcus chondri TaxID=3065941 RepID=A0ABU7JT45_9NOCA|nr:extracellular solute-binding protein [Rhodococcus sp. CC-R104]MEE2033201.1 extracellular solute-binding protein [Rhodococcus sp. CC-R104]
MKFLRQRSNPERPGRSRSLRPGGIATTAIAIGVVATMLTACGGGGDERIASDSVGDTGPAGDESWQQVVDAAKAEGEVTLYSSNAADAIAELARRFEADYDITVNIVRDVDANLHQKIDAENKTGNRVADVVTQATVSWAQELGAAGGAVEPVGPAFTDSASEYDADTLMRESNDFVTGASVLTYGWNTDRYPNGLEGYESMLDPDLSGGKIGIVLPTSTAHVDFYGSYLEQVGGEGFLDKLAEQKPRIYPGALPLAQALASGEIAAAVFVQDQTSERETGAPVDSAFGDLIWGGWMYTSILAGAPHPNAAQVLANYMITPAGQEALSFRNAAVLPDITSAVTTIDKVAPQDTAAMTPEALEQLKVRFGQLFNQ